MTSLKAFLVATALLLTACATPRVKILSDGGFDAGIFTAPPACQVLVHVVANNIVIDHEPVRTSRCSGTPRTVNFHLASSYKFPLSDGIKLKQADPEVECITQTGQKQVKCTFSAAPVGKEHRYVIQVLDSAGPLITLDPMMIND